MTDQEINIAIAEACGWKQGHSVKWTEKITRRYDWGWTPPANLAYSSVRYIPGKSSCVPPNYCHDLNAIREVLCTLSEGELADYVDNLLCLIHGVDKGYYSTVSWYRAAEIATASARQESEAFLKTIGKWKE